MALSGTGTMREQMRSRQTGEYIPKVLYDSIEQNRVALKGPVTTPIGGGFASINVTLRKKFELFANFRPVKNLPGLKTKYPDLDLIIVRENMEDLYAGLEHEVVPGVVQALKIITEKGSTRIAKFAFDYARKHGRKKIHAIHKANIMKLSDGLFLRCCRTIAKGFPEVDVPEHIVDNTCMQLVMNPLSVRHSADGESVRRYPERSLQRVCGWAWTGSGREPGDGVRDLRGGAWIGSGYCREGYGESYGVAAERGADAASHQ